MTPAEIGRKVGDVPGMLPFFTLVGAWIRRGDGLRAFRALRDVFGSDFVAWFVSEAWPVVEQTERDTGWTPEFWACGRVIAHVADWQSRNWIRTIRRWCGEFCDAGSLSSLAS